MTIKRGAPRMLQYLPSGEEFVCVNGKNRYTCFVWRTYGMAPETGDRPIFATYVKTTAVISVFALHLPDGRYGLHRWKKPIACARARYNPGTRTFLERQGMGKIAAWNFRLGKSYRKRWPFGRAFRDMPVGCELEVEWNPPEEDFP